MSPPHFLRNTPPDPPTPPRPSFGYSYSRAAAAAAKSLVLAASTATRSRSAASTPRDREDAEALGRPAMRLRALGGFEALKSAKLGAAEGDEDVVERDGEGVGDGAQGWFSSGGSC